jgi:hypothetical protein
MDDPLTEREQERLGLNRHRSRSPSQAGNRHLMEHRLRDPKFTKQGAQ